MAAEAVREFFSQEEESKIIDAIRKAELNTSGEIRVHIEKKCKKDAFKRATEIFAELNMQKTALRNGILFYIATNDHKFSIVGDKGINESVPNHFWESIRDEVQSDFRNSKFADGLEKGIEKCGNALKEFFPYSDDDINELPDEISTS